MLVSAALNVQIHNKTSVWAAVCQRDADGQAHNCKYLCIDNEARKQLDTGKAAYLTPIADLSPAKVLVLAFFAKPVRLLIASHRATCTNPQNGVQCHL